MKFWFVVPAAGVGSRCGGIVAKQYLQVAGKTVIEHTLERLLSLQPAGIVVAINPRDNLWESLEIARNPLITMVSGGGERADSVKQALDCLSALADEDDWVLVHDVARPCVRVCDVETLLNTLAESPVGGILAAPVSDTLKRVASSGEIESTRERSNLWAAMTPQMFRLGVLCEAVTDALDKNIVPTDEAMAMELAGYKPQVVAGSRDNIKITVPEDLAMAEAIMAWQEKSRENSEI